MEKIKALERLQESLHKLPSIGKKSAERMAYAMLEMDEDDLNELSICLQELKHKVLFCHECGSLTEHDLCEICQDNERDKTTLLVVSYPKDVLAFEKAENYHGLYHVLGGAISISKGKNIENLNIPKLLERIERLGIKEVIIATNPTIEGETTALYLSKIISPLGVYVTRLAYGLPMGGNLEYTDSLTIAKAIQGRQKI